MGEDTTYLALGPCLVSDDLGARYANMEGPFEKPQKKETSTFELGSSLPDQVRQLVDPLEFQVDTGQAMSDCQGEGATLRWLLER